MSPRSDNPYMNVPGFEEPGAIDVNELLGNTSPRELEIGFGKGHFILDRARANPDTRILGIETRRKWVQLVADRAAKWSIGNTVTRFGDARVAIKRMMPDACFERVFINFPDPWWKAKHAKRMVVTSEVATDLCRLLPSGGQIFVQTDVDFRHEAYRAELDGVGELTGGPVDNNPFGARSLREAHCEDLNLPIYRLLYTRK